MISSSCRCNIVLNLSLDLVSWCLSSPSSFTWLSAEHFITPDFIVIRLLFQVTRTLAGTRLYCNGHKKVIKKYFSGNLSVLSNLVGEISRNSEGEHLWNKDVYWTNWNHPRKNESFYICDSTIFLGGTSLEASHKIILLSIEASHKVILPSIPAVDNRHTKLSGNGVIKRDKIRISRSRDYFPKFKIWTSWKWEDNTSSDIPF
jgi:hypothetical protein